MMLTPNEHLTIILSAIRDYNEENDIAILIVEKISNQIIKSIDYQITTQDIYDEVVECFNFYNDFIKEKKVELPLIDYGFYELTREYLNLIIGEMNENNE